MSQNLVPRISKANCKKKQVVKQNQWLMLIVNEVCTMVSCLFVQVVHQGEKSQKTSVSALEHSPKLLINVGVHWSLFCVFLWPKGGDWKTSEISSPTILSAGPHNSNLCSTQGILRDQEKVLSLFKHRGCNQSCHYADVDPGIDWSGEAPTILGWDHHRNDWVCLSM